MDPHCVIQMVFRAHEVIHFYCSTPHPILLYSYLTFSILIYLPSIHTDCHLSLFIVIGYQREILISCLYRSNRVYRKGQLDKSIEYDGNIISAPAGVCVSLSVDSLERESTFSPSFMKRWNFCKCWHHGYYFQTDTKTNRYFVHTLMQDEKDVQPKNFWVWLLFWLWASLVFPVLKYSHL